MYISAIQYEGELLDTSLCLAEVSVQMAHGACPLVPQVVLDAVISEPDPIPGITSSESDFLDVGVIQLELWNVAGELFFSGSVDASTIVAQLLQPSWCNVLTAATPVIVCFPPGFRISHVVHDGVTPKGVHLPR